MCTMTQVLKKLRKIRVSYNKKVSVRGSYARENKRKKFHIG